VFKKFFKKSFHRVPFCFLFLILSACGDNSPFDEDYWEETNADDQTSEEEANQPRAFVANLNTISQNVGNISGTASLRIEEDTVTTTTELSDVPQSLMLGQRSITAQTCEQVAAQAVPPVIVNEESQFKTSNTLESGTRESLIAEINQADPQSGGSLDLAGRSYVIKAYVQIVNSPLPQAATLIPVACGIIQVDEQTETEESTTGGTAGGTVGGTTGSVTGGTVSGTVNGTTINGTVGGSVGGLQGTFDDSPEF